MLDVEIIALSAGRFRAVCDGHQIDVAAKREPVFAMARHLQGLGYAGETVLRPVRSGRPGMAPAPLEAFADLAVSEPDRGSARIVRYVANPMATAGRAS